MTLLQGIIQDVLSLKLGDWKEYMLNEGNICRVTYKELFFNDGQEPIRAYEIHSTYDPILNTKSYLIDDPDMISCQVYRLLKMTEQEILN